MSMSMRNFRTVQAIESFEACYNCETLPENKKAEVMSEINKAKTRKEQQDAEVSCFQLCLTLPSVKYQHIQNDINRLHQQT